MKLPLLAGALMLGTFTASAQLPILPGLTTPDGKVAPTDPNAPVPETVVSVKPTKPGNDNIRIRMTAGIFQATNISVKMLLSNATGIREALIFGLPSWAESQRWDVNAKILADEATLKNMTREQRRALLMSILSDRFKIKTHIEQKELPIYDLVLLKQGPDLKTSALQLAEPNNPDRKPKGSFNISNTEMTATDIPLSSLASNLAQQTGRNVIDKTGLKGTFDVRLKWTRDEDAGADNGSTDKPPVLSTALQEQLGLKLVPTKGPVDTLVVDHAELPAED